MRLVGSLLLGAVAGVGVFVAARSARPGALNTALQRLGGSAAVGGSAVPGTSLTANGTLHGDTSTLRRAWGPLVGLISGRLTTRQQQDLAVLDRDPVAYAATKVTSSLLASLSTLVLMVAAGLAGVSVAAVLLVGTTLGAAVVGFVLPDRRLRLAAQHRRTDATAALSSYLDLVTVLLAGGAGLETALHAAADAGGGYAYGQLRAALVRARTTRQSAWTCFAELGRRTGIDELVELSASVQLAGQQGARIALSLATRAATLRARVLAGIEAEAHSASERMGLPTVLMFIGFLFLLGFPAARVILAAS